MTSVDMADYDIRVSDAWLDRTLLRIEHRLLSPGASDMAALRGYLRLKAWRSCRTRGDRLRAVLALVKLPARALRGARQAVAEHGERVRRDVGVPRRKQLLDLWWLWVRHGVFPKTYYTYGLYRPGQLRRAPDFLQGGEATDLYRLLSARVAPAEAALLADKSRFEAWLVEKRIPTLTTLVEFRGGAVVRSSLPSMTLPRRDLFSKPTGSEAGAGARGWTYDGAGWVGPDGRRRGEGELLAELAELSREQGMLLQERVSNHPALAPLAPGALSTIRVLSVRGVDGTVQVVLAVCKIPTGTAATDHMKYGGLAAPVDLQTGRLGPAIRKDEIRFLAPCELHPDTGARIEGFQLPDWERVKRLAVRAHEALDAIVCIGWDVAILEDGPIIVEGNDNPGSASTQMPTGVALGETPVVSALAAHFRRAFARPSHAAASGGARAATRRPAELV